jgi:PAS domain S-box-containing protein
MHTRNHLTTANRNPEPPTVSPSTTTSGAASAAGPATVFIVEDDSQITLLIRTYLTRSGYRVAGAAPAGDEALVQIEVARPDLVLMDISLEGELDGIQTATVVAARFEIPVVFLTGLADEETLQRSQQAEAFGYLLKPFDQEDLKAAIDLALSKHRTESHLRHVDRWFAAAIRSITDGVIATDQADRITFLNPVAERLTGHSAGQALGRALARTFVLAEETPDGTRSEPATKAEGLRFEARLVDADQQMHPIECTAAPLRNAEGRTIGRIIVFRDISARHQAEFELHQSHEQMRALTGHLQTAREAERQHIAREIHDEFGQLLTGLRMDLVWLDKRLQQTGGPGSLEPLQRRLSATLNLVDTMVKQVRRIASELRPGVLDDLGLVAALEWQAREWQERTHIPCRFTSSHDHVALSLEPRTALFRIFQEALTNVARHAEATAVDASLVFNPGNIRLVVSDNGKGLPPQPAPTKSFGLLGMRERAMLSGGTLELAGKPGAGTTVSVQIPIPLCDAA